MISWSRLVISLSKLDVREELTTFVPGGILFEVRVVMQFVKFSNIF